MGLIAYHFTHDNLGTIIFDIGETDLHHVSSESQAMFEVGRKYNWPGPWNSSDEAAMIYLKANNIKAFSVTSSYGLDGWVLARCMQMTTRTIDGRGPL